MDYIADQILLKAMVFPVVMFACESWTIKKAEHRRIDAFELWCQTRLFRVPWTTQRPNQSILKEYSLEGLMLKLMSIDSVMPSNYLILCFPFLQLPSIFLSMRVFSNESALHIRWPEQWNFSFSISPSNEYSALIYFRIDWFDLLAIQGTSRVFSNTTVQKHHFFSAQPSLQSNSYIHT